MLHANTSICLSFLELVKVPKSVTRREKIPVGTTCEYLDGKNASVKENAFIRSPSKEETKLSAKNSEQSSGSVKKYAVETEPVNIVLLPAAQVTAREKERKSVKIRDDHCDTKTANEREGNNSLTSASSRSVSSCVYARGNQHRPASFFFRCMNYAMHFFIYLLSVACSVISQFQLPTFNFSKLFRRMKMMANEKDA